MNEKTITTKILQYVNNQPNSYAIKYFSSVTGGKNLPDIVGGYKGKPFWIEVKQPGAKSRSGQLIAQKLLNQAGFVTGTITSLDEFKGLFS